MKPLLSWSISSICVFFSSIQRPKRRAGWPINPGTYRVAAPCSQYVGESRSEHCIGGGDILMYRNPPDGKHVRSLPVPAVLSSGRQMIARTPNHFAQALRVTPVRVAERDEVAIDDLAGDQHIQRLAQFMLSLFLGQRRQERVRG